MVDLQLLLTTLLSKAVAVLAARTSPKAKLLENPPLSKRHTDTREIQTPC